MSDTTSTQGKYPHVIPDQLRICAEYGHLFHNTGGNDPADLLNDLQRPHTAERPNYMASTNVVRFTLAVGVQSQVYLIAKLERIGALDTAKAQEQ